MAVCDAPPFCGRISKPIPYVNSMLHTYIGPNTVYDPNCYTLRL